tara:strand:+ start:269 stop:616 length:348 start_codon:yes stop_codon:yes gene_type:complete
MIPPIRAVESVSRILWSKLAGKLPVVSGVNAQTHNTPNNGEPLDDVAAESRGRDLANLSDYALEMSRLEHQGTYPVTEGDRSFAIVEMDRLRVEGTSLNPGYETYNRLGRRVVHY